MERYVGKHQKEPGHQTRDTASPVDNVRSPGDRAGRFFDLDHRVAAALALPDLGAAVKRVVRLLLEHSGDGLTDDVALVLASSRDNVT